MNESYEAEEVLDDILKSLRLTYLYAIVLTKVFSKKHGGVLFQEAHLYLLVARIRTTGQLIFTFDPSPPMAASNSLYIGFN